MERSEYTALTVRRPRCIAKHEQTIVCLSLRARRCVESGVRGLPRIMSTCRERDGTTSGVTTGQKTVNGFWASSAMPHHVTERAAAFTNLYFA
jgi:hypothetical protein